MSDNSESKEPVPWYQQTPEQLQQTSEKLEKSKKEVVEIIKKIIEAMRVREKNVFERRGARRTTRRQMYELAQLQSDKKRATEHLQKVSYSLRANTYCMRVLSEIRKQKEEKSKPTADESSHKDEQQSPAS